MMRNKIVPSLAFGLSLLAASVPALCQQVVRLPRADAALRARPEVLYSVGAADGRDWEVFGNVANVAFDAAENLYVLDKGNARVLVFDPAGRFLRAIGRRGGGPGEFSTPLQMAVTKDGEVVVSDAGRSAFSIFGPDGAFRRSVPFAQEWVVVGTRLAAHPRGGVVTRGAGNPMAGSREAAEPVLWYTLRGGAPAPIFSVRLAAAGRSGPAGSPLRIARKPVFSPGTHFGVLPNGGLAVAHTAGYSVKLVGATGQVQRVIERPISPRAVTRRDREAEIERRTQRYTRPGGITIAGADGASLPPSVRASISQQLQQMEFASVMPVIQALEVDAAGNLWIQRAGPAPGRPGPIDIVTPQGAYVGTLVNGKLPEAFSGRGRIAHVETDELGVQRVVVSRLPAQWR